MAERFSQAEWDSINARLAGHEVDYGIPERRPGSLVFGSWNIRKFGTRTVSGGLKRSPQSYDLIVRFARQCDLLAIQEALADLESVRWLVGELNRATQGSPWRMIVSDITGTNPGDDGDAERLAYVWNSAVFTLADIVSDISFDRKSVLNKVNANLVEVRDQILAEAGAASWENIKTRIMNFVGFDAPKLPKFFEFVRAPYLAVFETFGNGGNDYRIACVNAHLISGTKREREREFFALLEWLHFVCASRNADAPVFMLLADLNLDFDSNNDKRRQAIDQQIVKWNSTRPDKVEVNFPFLDPHPMLGDILTNSREKQTYDHIACFSRDNRFPTAIANSEAGRTNPDRFDYGMFNFLTLFRDALYSGAPTAAEQKAMYAKFEFDLSDHMPIWVRMPVPHAGQRRYT